MQKISGNTEKNAAAYRTHTQFTGVICATETATRAEACLVMDGDVPEEKIRGIKSMFIDDQRRPK